MGDGDAVGGEATAAADGAGAAQAPGGRRRRRAAVREQGPPESVFETGGLAPGVQQANGPAPGSVLPAAEPVAAAEPVPAAEPAPAQLPDKPPSEAAAG
jgi:hypothetical protein